MPIFYYNRSKVVAICIKTVASDSKIVITYKRELSLFYNPEYKGVRLDVYAADENNTRYDIEMQIAKQHLGKRARYYHSQMDMELLESGHEYLKLPERIQKTSPKR